MKNTEKTTLVTVSVKLDADRIALMDNVAVHELADRSQILRWAVEAFLIHQQNTKTALRPQVMLDLMTEHLRAKGVLDPGMHATGAINTVSLPLPGDVFLPPTKQKGRRALSLPHQPKKRPT